MQTDDITAIKRTSMMATTDADAGNNGKISKTSAIHIPIRRGETIDDYVGFVLTTDNGRLIARFFHEAKITLDDVFKTFGRISFMLREFYVDEKDCCQYLIEIQIGSFEYPYVAPSDPVGPGTWILFFEDQDMRPEHFGGTGAREAAIKRYIQASTQWSCHLFQKMEIESRSATPGHLSTDADGPNYSKED